jgi:hypothetical protein
MKSWIPFGLILIAFIFLDCTPPVVFDQAQPIEGQTVSEIPDAYQGLYICESDSTLIIISDQIVYAQHEHFFVISTEGLEEREDCSLMENEIYLPGKEMCIPIEYIDENTVKGYITDIDTLFIMNEGHAAKTYKGHLFLSKQLREEEWAVSMLSHDEEGNILYRSITEDSDLKGIRRITPMKDITRPTDRKRRFKITPDQKAFDRLISNNDIFIDCEYLMRVNLEVEHPESF